MSYFEFAVASNFSFLRGASHPEELMLQASHIGLAGIGLTDRNSVAGVVRAHLFKREKALPLAYHPGARLVFADGTPDILAYPRDRAGWGRLCRLLTRGNLRAKKGDCILYIDDLIQHIDGIELIVMEQSTGEVPPAHLTPNQQAAFDANTPANTQLRLIAGKNKSPPHKKSDCFLSCAMPLPVACGWPRACSIAAMTARDWLSVPRWRCKPACRSSPSMTRSIIIPIDGSCRMCSPASASI